MIRSMCFLMVPLAQFRYSFPAFVSAIFADGLERRSCKHLDKIGRRERLP